MKPALLGEKTSLAGLKTLIIILLLRYDVYDDIVDLSQTFLVVEEVRRTEGIFTFPELLDISSWNPHFAMYLKSTQNSSEQCKNNKYQTSTI